MPPLALELAGQVPDLDTVLVPVGGGGLIAGIAAWFAGAVRVVGVEPVGAPTLTMARAHGAPVDTSTTSFSSTTSRSWTLVGRSGSSSAWWPSPLHRSGSPRC